MSEPQQYSAQPHAAQPQPSAPPQYPAQQQYPAQPQYPAQQYPAQPQYPSQPHGPASPQAAQATGHGTPAGNTLGRAAFFVAVASAGFGILYSVITPFLFTSGNYDIADSLGNVFSVLILLSGIVAVVLSILALRRPAPHLLAAIALGIAGSVVVGRLLSWMASLLYIVF